jgi:large subunit ribosomal protein L18
VRFLIKKTDANKKRWLRHKRVRNKISGTAQIPRLNVFRSANNIYAQLIDDVKQTTLTSASSLDKTVDGYGGNKAAAKKVGELLAKKALQNNIKKVVFDRGGYIFHGRVKELAEGARSAGLDF